MTRKQTNDKATKYPLTEAYRRASDDEMRALVAANSKRGFTYTQND